LAVSLYPFSPAPAKFNLPPIRSDDQLVTALSHTRFLRGAMTMSTAAC
jgi:hypothetical protein